MGGGHKSPACGEDRKKRHHAKTTTGCLTCRTRHVKCGEEKPQCLRCIKFGSECTYAYGTQVRALVQTQRPILPKDESPIPLSIIPSPSRFANERERGYFDVFCNKTAFEIFPRLEMTRLRSIFLQAFESESSIRHSIIALGALGQTSQSAHNQKLGLCSGHNDNANEHFQNALTQYNQAIKCMRNTDSQDIRIILLSSLAILSFEGWKGTHSLAVQQIATASRLLHDWREREKDPNNLLQGVVDDVLLDIFARLSLQLISSGAARSSGSYSVLNTYDWGLIDNVPKEFKALEEAGQYITANIRLLIKFITKGYPPCPKSSSARTYPNSVFWDMMTPELAIEQDVILQNCLRWLSAFSTLQPQLNMNDRAIRAASTMLELHTKATYLSAITATAEDEMVFDSYNDLYENMVSLSTVLLQLNFNADSDLEYEPHSPVKARTPKFCLDVEVGFPLWAAALKCRNFSTRKRAIALLLDYPRREGIWESEMAGRIAERVTGFEEVFRNSDGVTVEEDGDGGGTGIGIGIGEIPEWARIRSVVFKQDLVGRRAVVEFRQFVDEMMEGFVERREVVCW